MPSMIARIALLTSSFAPIVLVWGVVDFIENNLSFTWRTWILLGVFLMFLILPPVVLRLCSRKLGDETVSYQSAKILENGGEGFVGVYILPFLSNVITDHWYLLMIGIMVILTAVTWVNNTFCFNPALSLFGYRFYEVTNTKNVTFILLSRNIINDPNDVKHVYNVTHYLKLDGRKKQDV